MHVSLLALLSCGYDFVGVFPSSLGDRFKSLAAAMASHQWQSNVLLHVVSVVGRMAYQRMRGSLIRLLLGRMFGSEDYTSLSDEQKIKEVEEGIREVDDAARDKMITRVVDRRLGRQEAGVPMGPPASVQ